MGDTTTTQKIIIDTTQAGESVEALNVSMEDLAAITKAAEEGVEHVGDSYKFANKGLQEWYDNLVKMHLEHNKFAVDLIDGMQKASVAAKQAATAQGEHAEVIKKGTQAATHELEHQKIAFEDLGRLALGEKVGLRQFAQLFGVLGPAVGVAAFAVFEYGGELLKMIDPQEDANRKVKEFEEVMVKSGDATAQATINVEKMQATFAGSTSIQDRKKALDDYNKTFGDIIGYQDTFEKAEQNLADKTELYKAAMKQRAIADAAYALQKAKIAEALKAEVEGETGFGAKLKAGFQYMTGDIASVGQTLLDSNKKIVSELNSDADDLAKKADEAEKKFNEIRSQAGGGTGQKPGKTTKDNSLEEQKRYLEESAKIKQDAEDKEITNENIKYEKVRKDLEAHHHSTEALDEQHAINVAAIHQKYADQLAAQIKKERDKLAEDDRKATEAYEKQLEKDAEDKKKQEAKDFADRQKAEASYLNAEFAALQNQIKLVRGHYAQKKALIDQDLKEAKFAFDQGLISRQDYEKKQAEIGRAGLEVKRQLAEEEKMIANAAVSTLDSLSKIAGEKTAAGKDLAIAAATIKAIQAGINTFEGFTSQFPGPVGIALGAVAAAGVGVALFEQVKKIEEVKIPGASGGGASASSPSAPSAPSVPSKASATTNLSNDSLNRMKTSQNTGAPIRAVVVESDVTNSQNRIASYKKGSSL